MYAKIKTGLRNLLNSGMKDDYTNEANRKTLIINLFAFVGLAFEFIFTIKEFNLGQYLIGIFTAIMGVATLADLIYLKVTHDYKTAGWVIIILMFLLLVFLLIFGGGEDKILWFYVFPLLAYFILGNFAGGIINFILFLTTLVLFFFPLPVMFEIDPAFRSRFLAGYLAVTCLAHTFEFIRYKTYNLLLSAHKKTHEYLQQTVQQKEEIETQAEQLELINQELRKLSAVVRETNNAVMILDENGKVDWVNDAFTQLYGYNIIDLNEAYDYNILQSDFNKFLHEKATKVINSYASLTFETLVKAKDQTIIEAQTTLTPLYDEDRKLKKLIIIDTDIRWLKETERKLEKLNATKDKFFSIIAHDLKNPFNAIIGITRMLTENPDKYSKERLNYFHKSLYDVSQSSYNLLINLLEWANSQTGKLEFDPQTIQLQDIVKETFGLVKADSEEKKVALYDNVSSDIYVNADLNMLRTILRNLVTNGLKYTEENGSITVAAGIMNDKVQVDVTDTGVGISEEEQKKLFRIDEQFSKKGTKDEEGTGLGLVLCKEFVEKNGGEIWVKSNTGQGSTFSFTLLKANQG